MYNWYGGVYENSRKLFNDGLSSKIYIIKQMGVMGVRNRKYW